MTAKYTARTEFGDLVSADNIYTVFVDGKLWTNVIDDMHSHCEWSWGGIIFLSKQHAVDFVACMRTYDEHAESTINIVQLSYAIWHDSQGV